MKEAIDLILEKLSNACGVGYVSEVAEFVAEEVRPYCDQVEIDKTGSVVARKIGKGKKEVMLASHLDEIGFIVSNLDQGYIQFSPIGGFDSRILPGQKVTIYSKKKLSGYIGMCAPHYIPRAERNKVLEIKNLYIDTGLPARKIKKLVQIGDFICFEGNYTKLAGGLRSGKALDNRASVTCAILTLKMLKDIEHNCNINFVATAQEEETSLGARTAAFRLKLNLAVVIDVSHGEHPEIKEYECFPLGKGPVIGKGSVLSSRLNEDLIGVAQRLEIPYQIECLPSATGTDADDVAFTKEGIPTALISLPLRYMHTPVEVVSLVDIERTARLLTNYLAGL